MNIYLDCNATTPCEPQVAEKISQFLIKDFGNEGSHTHAYGSVAKQSVQAARDQIAGLVDATRNEIIKWKLKLLTTTTLDIICILRILL